MENVFALNTMNSQTEICPTLGVGDFYDLFTEVVAFE